MCLLKRHLAFILPLIIFHALSFSAGDSTGNQVKTNTFSEFSLVVSRGSFWCVPFVLLLLISSLLKKYGRSLSAHLCHSDSLCRMFLTTDSFLGVTQLPISWSPTWDSVTSGKLAGVEAVGGVGTVGVSGSGGSGKMSTSSARLAKATESIVWRSSCWWMLMADGSSGSGIYFKRS